MHDPQVKTLYTRTPSSVQVGAERTVFIPLRKVLATAGEQGPNRIEASIHRMPAVVVTQHH